MPWAHAERAVPFTGAVGARARDRDGRCHLTGHELTALRATHVGADTQVAARGLRPRLGLLGGHGRTAWRLCAGACKGWAIAHEAHDIFYRVFALRTLPGTALPGTTLLRVEAPI